MPAVPTLLERLGFENNDRVLIIHGDDAGMCHSANVASIRAMTEGVMPTASVMVPCPWFPEMAAWARETPDADLGVHVTLTSEWKIYRWRLVAPISQVPGLVDPDGYMWRSVQEVIQHASAEEVETEVRAQVERALQFGIRPTHVDSHMGTLFYDSRFFEVYTRVSKEFGLPAMLPEPTPEVLEVGRQVGVDFAAFATQLKADGHLFINRLIRSAEGNTYEQRKASFYRLIRGLSPGVTQIIVHLNGNHDEVRHITASWETRYNEFLICTEDETRRLLADEGIHVIGWKPLLDAFQAANR